MHRSNSFDAHIKILTILAEYVRGGKGGGTSEESAGRCLPAIFIDYENMYVSYTYIVIHTYVHKYTYICINSSVAAGTYINTL